MRFAVSYVIDPQIAGSGRARVVIKQPRIVASEGRGPARNKVHPLWQGQGVRFSGCDLIQVDVGVAIYVRVVGQKLAVGRKALTRNLPLVLRKPADFLARDFEQAGVVVAVTRSEEHTSELQ